MCAAENSCAPTTLCGLHTKSASGIPEGDCVGAEQHRAKFDKRPGVSWLLTYILEHLEVESDRIRLQAIRHERADVIHRWRGRGRRKNTQGTNSSERKNAAFGCSSTVHPERNAMRKVSQNGNSNRSGQS